MNYLTLIDSVHGVDNDYSANMKAVGNVLLEAKAAEQCLKMLEAAINENVHIKPLSGYRSAKYQQMLWNRTKAEYICEGLKESDAEKLCSRFLARVNHSEHQTGLAVDFCSPDWDDTQDDFYSTKQGRWLCKNADSFGFILRYPRMKEHITGIAYEPWHYRYVGTPHSEIIRREGLTLEEYLYYYEDFLPFEQ